MTKSSPATIAILGAGPIGLEAALYARYLGYSVQVYERHEVAGHVKRWGHIRMFTPFQMNCSSLGLAALAAGVLRERGAGAAAHRFAGVSVGA